MNKPCHGHDLSVLFAKKQSNEKELPKPTKLKFWGSLVHAMHSCDLSDIKWCISLTSKTKLSHITHFKDVCTSFTIVRCVSFVIFIVVVIGCCWCFFFLLLLLSLDSLDVAFLRKMCRESHRFLVRFIFLLSFNCTFLSCTLWSIVAVAGRMQVFRINYCGRKIAQQMHLKCWDWKWFWMDGINGYSGCQSQMTIDQLIVTAPIVAFIARTWSNENIYFVLWRCVGAGGGARCVCLFFSGQFSTTMIIQKRYLYFIHCTCVPSSNGHAIYVHRKGKN